jgi:hypothetical protein
MPQFHARILPRALPCALLLLSGCVAAPAVQLAAQAVSSAGAGAAPPAAANPLQHAALAGVPAAPAGASTEQAGLAQAARGLGSLMGRFTGPVRGP